MSDRIPSDHASVNSYRLNLSTIGRSGRLQLLLPDEIGLRPGDLISLSLGGDQYFSYIASTLDGLPAIRGAYPNRKLARDQEGHNSLQSWLAAADFGAGDAIVFDELRRGYAYGLREPGDRVIYEPPPPPDSSLVEIAESFRYRK